MSRLLDRAEELLAAATVIAMALLAFANVVTRYLVSYSLAFTEELEVAGLVWLTMLGASIGFRRSVHLGFSILRDRFPRRVRQAIALLTILVTIGTALVLMWAGLVQIRAERSLDTISEALGVPQWIYTATLPIGAVLIVIRVVQTARREIEQA